MIEIPAELPELLTTSLEHTCTLTLHPAGGAEAVPLEPEVLRVELDEGWTPHITLNAAVPTDPELLELLDPRLGPRITCTAGYMLPGRVPATFPLGDLLLYRAGDDEPADIVTLLAHSDEIRTQERPFHGGTFPLSTAGVHEAIGDLIRYAMPGLAAPVITSESVPTGYRPEVLTDLLAEGLPPAGDPVWSLIEEILAASETRLYVNSLGHWIHTHTPEQASLEPAHVLRSGVDGTLIRRGRERNRTDWANYVLRVHEWTTDDGRARRVIGAARTTSGPYAIGTVGVVSKVHRSSVPTTAANATNGARAMLRRAMTGGAGCAVTAIAAYWLRPGDTVHLQMDDDTLEAHLVARIEFDLSSGTMHLETRRPLNPYTIEIG